jgi:sec-independent protein translocase protein TatB
MFDIGWGEMIVIGVVALVAIGPKELPGVLRTAGQWMGKMRRMASEFQGQFNEALREAEVADLKKQFDDVKDSATNFTKQIENPLESTRASIEGAFDDKPAASETATAATPAPSIESIPPLSEPPAVAAPETQTAVTSSKPESGAT